jgi:KDO2-lipid IV(A) lauroyltransferase
LQPRIKQLASAIAQSIDVICQPTLSSLLLRLIAGLPLQWVHRLGAMAGWATYIFSRRYRDKLRSNLALAVGVDSPEALPRSLLRAAVAEAGKQAFEMPWVLLRPREEIVRKVIHVEGWDLVEAARQAGSGILFLTPHLGCFEITAQFAAQSAPITVLYRPPKQAALEPVIQAGRARGQMRLAPANISGVRTLVKALRQSEAVGMLPDQVPAEGDGIWAPYFGRPAWTMTLAARLSEVKNVSVIFAWAQRLPAGAGYCLRFVSPAEPVQGSLDERVLIINREMERMIHACPAQYLWGYNRYKRPAGAPPRPGVDAS